MTIEQNTYLIASLFQSKNKGVENLIDTLMSEFSISERDVQHFKQKILEEYNQGVRNLNLNQFNNLISIARDENFNENEIVTKLNFYEIKKEHHQNIIKFLKGHERSYRTISVYKMDSNFKGVQVATNDNFNEILSCGYTGDWVIDPKNVKPLRVQIASMNETGSYPRGYYMNADIDRMEPIKYQKKIRYRIYLKNPTVVNSGNRNIKFSNNPVRYIK